MTKSSFYREVAAQFEQCSRNFFLSLSRGVFVLAPDGKSYHDLLLTRYPVHSMKGPFLPRFNIDRQWSMRRLPLNVARRWRVSPGSEGLFSAIGLEVTVTEAQYDALAGAVPKIISHIEDGRRDGFEELLPFETKLTSSTNLWSSEAKEIARKANEQYQALASKR